MYNHVLDFGALMISELTDFAQPVYIYIPDGGQLRGGSMVVFSKSINPGITFCVAPTAHINVLEPNATKELKYKPRDVERYAGLNGLTVAEADQVASLYTELNDVVNHEHAILNDPARGKVIDAVCSPAELRAFIIERG
jgi:acetyl-CoA carboxylase carboxyltransferase component